MNESIETPKTDEVVDSCGDYEKPFKFFGRLAAVSRELERALAAKTAEYEGLNAVHVAALDKWEMCTQERDRLRASNERLVKALRLDAPWPLTEVLIKLANSAEHLLTDHGCDTHGHEGIRDAMRAANAIVAALAAGKE